MSDEAAGYELTRISLGSRNRQTGDADGLLGALDDLADNRIPLSVRERIFQARQVVHDAITERDGLRREIILQYDESGQGWKSPEDAPEECLEELGELLSGLVELDLGSPVVLNGTDDSVQFESDRNFRFLREVGFLEIAEGTE